MAKRERSPNFPQITLAKAIENATALFKEVGRSSVSRENALGALGYKSLNGRSLGILAALRHYGLLDGQKDHVSLSEIALRIVHPLSDADKQATIAECLYRPKLFADIRESRGDLSEKILAAELYHKEGFTQDGASRAAQIFHENRAFIGDEAPEFGNENGLDNQSESPDTEPERGNLPESPVNPPSGQKTPVHKPPSTKALTGNMIAEISVPLAGNQLTLALVGSDPVLEEDIEDIDMLIDYLKRQLRRKVARETSTVTEEDCL